MNASNFIGHTDTVAGLSTLARMDESSYRQYVNANVAVIPIKLYLKVRWGAEFGLGAAVC